MKNVTCCLVLLSAATLFVGCSQGNAYDDPASAAPPLAPSSTPDKMTAAESKMMETMSPGGIADPDREI